MGTSFNNRIMESTAKNHFNIPMICPKCQKLSNKQELSSTTTLVHFTTMYDASGNIIPNDRKNTVTTLWRCVDCGHCFHTTS